MKKDKLPRLYQEFLDNESNHDLQPDEAYGKGWNDCKQTILEMFKKGLTLTLQIKEIEDL